MRSAGSIKSSSSFYLWPGRSNLNSKRSALEEILDYVLNLLEETIQRNGIRMEKNWDKDLPPVMGDRTQLTQAFLNLLNNALEAYAPGWAA